jgi:hypothetical protein
VQQQMVPVVQLENRKTSTRNNFPMGTKNPATETPRFNAKKFPDIDQVAAA